MIRSQVPHSWEEDAPPWADRGEAAAGGGVGAPGGCNEGPCSSPHSQKPQQLDT